MAEQGREISILSPLRTELRCGHITSVYFGMGWRELFWELYPAVVPCATADEESGSSLKLGSYVGQHYVLLGT